MTLNKKLQHFKIIDTDFVQFNVEWGYMYKDKSWAISVTFYMDDKESYSITYPYTDKAEMEEDFNSITEDDCLEIYYAERDKPKPSLN